MGDKTFVFTPEQNGSGGGLGALMGMIPALLNGKGLDPNLVAALMNNRNNQEGFGGGCWWIWIILLFFIWGWGGNGNGFGGRGMNGLPAELNNDAGRELLMNAIQGNGNAINQLSSTLGCSVQQLQSAICNIQGSIDKVSGQVGMTSQQVINAIQSNSSAIGSQLASCCCDIRTAIERQGYESQLATLNQTGVLSGKIDNQTQVINDKFCQLEMREMQNKIDQLRENNSTLLNQLSQEHQNNYFAQVSAQTIAPVNAALGDLSSRLAKIECKQPATVTIPYIPSMGSLIPVNYSMPVSGLSPYGTGCGC